MISALHMKTSPLVSLSGRQIRPAQHIAESFDDLCSARFIQFLFLHAHEKMHAFLINHHTHKCQSVIAVVMVDLYTTNQRNHTLYNSKQNPERDFMTPMTQTGISLSIKMQYVLLFNLFFHVGLHNDKCFPSVARLHAVFFYLLQTLSGSR